MENNKADEAAGQKPATAQPPPEDRVVTRSHSLELADGPLHYTTQTGTVVLREEDDKEGHKPRAEMFFVAYTLDDADARARPLTFSFNGGPGSSSVWLHLGVLGPRRVPSDGAGGHLAPPYHLQDNELTLLRETDLVFIDPIGTGYSRMITGEKVNPNEFHEYQRDIDSVGEFIRHYCTRNLRWGSPKFLIGESYGTTRAAGLSGHLQDRLGLFLNGVMLVSSILNFQTVRFNAGNDLPYILYLPSFAATAWFHHRLEPRLQALSLDALCREVRAFAEGDYAQALMRGSRLAARTRTAVVRRLARYTGLSRDYVDGADLRIEIMRFTKELLRGDGYTVGRFDSRIRGRDRDRVGEHFESDPSHDVVHGVYSTCLNDYVRRELGFESDRPYEVLARLFPKWRFEAFVNQYVNAAETLRTAMMKNPHLGVLVANGYYDLATPFFATEYTFDHLGIPADLTGNVSMTYYEAGHMMYAHRDSLERLAADLKRFVLARSASVRAVAP
jgi:carboxypeptidase C (cathepsin A)